MMDLYLIFGFVKGSFHGTRLCWVKRESNEGELTPRAFSARSPGVSTAMFRYYPVSYTHLTLPTILRV